MPQMAPIWWTLIMMISISTLVLTMILSYFNFSSKLKIHQKLSNKKMYWKWY